MSIVRSPGLKKSKYYFTLPQLNTPKIHKLYNIESPRANVAKTTNIQHLDSANQNIGTISFLDESKRSHLCNVSMIDFNRLHNINNTNVSYNCFWCRHPFNTYAIGCPIRYIPHQAKKEYYSHISKDTYNITENITTKRKDQLENTDDDLQDVTVEQRDYYQTDGVFCSFNCCKAYIDDNIHNDMYRSSNMLLIKMYRDIVRDKISQCINPAPHWRVLKAYGGHVNINKFRNNFDKLDYKNHGLIRFYPIGHLFEDKIKF